MLNRNLNRNVVTLTGQAETSDKPFPHVPVFDLKRRSKMENLKTERVGPCILQLTRWKSGQAESYRTYYRIDVRLPSGAYEYYWIHRETPDIAKANYWYNQLVKKLKERY